MKPQLLRRKNLGESNPNWRGGKLNYNCKFCKKSFSVFPSLKRTKFCSKYCYWNWLRKNQYRFRDKISKATKLAMADPQIRNKISQAKKGHNTGHKYLKGHTPWNKGKGKQKVKVIGKSTAEDEAYEQLLKYFNPSEIIRNTYKVIKSPLTRYPLELDFYLPKYKLAIEVDGKTHRTPELYGKERLKIQQRNDKIKEQELKKLGINLARVPYGDDIGVFGEFAIIDYNYLKELLNKLTNHSNYANRSTN